MTTDKHHQTDTSNNTRDPIQQHQDVFWMTPHWPAPANVRACSTLKGEPDADNPYADLNLGDHVGDAPEHVAKNRTRLTTALNLAHPPQWLTQVHGTTVIEAEQTWQAQQPPSADAIFTTKPQQVCAVLTADCLPILLCDHAGTVVAAVHAGWRGLAAGIIEKTVMKMGDKPRIMAWLGPAIGPQHFEVEDDVRQAFIQQRPDDEGAFKSSAPGKWHANLYQLATYRLQRLGVQDIYGGHWCSWKNDDLFFSVRRRAQTGRQASLIWLENNQ